MKTISSGSFNLNCLYPNCTNKALLHTSPDPSAPGTV